MAMNQLHPGARWLFRIRAYSVLIFLNIFLGFWLVIPFGAVILASLKVSGYLVLITSLVLTFMYLLLAIVIGEIYARMSYNRWFYEFTHDGLRLERGIIWKRYSNVPYERIQNVDIHRGIIARILGFSSLMIQTAGYSAQPHAEGYIPALDMGLAEQTRTFVMGKITSRRGK